jgi:hypothetical protein
VGIVPELGLMAQGISQSGQLSQRIVAGFHGFVVVVGNGNGMTSQIVFSFGTLAVYGCRFAVHRVIFVLGGVAVGVGDFDQM